MSARSKDFKVAVIGGGIGGLTLAVSLIRCGIKVDIFEQARKFEEIGAGISIGPNTIDALRSLGILDAVLRRTEEHQGQPPFLFISGLPGHEEIFQYPGTGTDITIGAHRASFLDTLNELIPQDIAHFSKKYGTTHTADILVGCDGLKSAVRTLVAGKTSEAKFSRTVAYRGLVPIKDAVAAVGENIVHQPVMFLGPDGHLVVFPVKEKGLINVVAFSSDRSKPAEEQGPRPGEPWVVPATQEELLHQYEAWGPKVLDLLQNIKKPSRWYLHSLNPPLESYIKGQVALLGDAAHATLPHLGAGAGQAIEDALVLSQLLAHPSTTRSNLEPVLEAYDHVRLPRANRVVTSSSAAGDIYEHRGPNGGSLEGLRKDLDGIWDWIWHHDLDRDLRQAVERLESRNVFVGLT